MTAITLTTDPIVSDPYFPLLTDDIISASGLRLDFQSPDALAAHVSERLRKLKLCDCREYWDLLHDETAGEAELGALIERLSIGETHFFRHRELFDALRDVAIPEIIQQNRATQRLRVWSAGCSTGPEAYSVSILLRRDLWSLVENWNVSILGTDISRPSLSQAVEGRYEEWAFRGTPAELRRDCFANEGKSWRIAPRFQTGVTFDYHDLVRHDYPSQVRNLAAFDLILCRNVLIYFAPEIVERIVRQLSECLVAGGWLAIGHAEHGVKCLDELEAMNLPGATLYRKQENNAVCSLADQEKASCGAGRLHVYPKRRSVAVPGAVDRGLGRPGSLEKIRELADQGDIETALQLCGTLIESDPLYAAFYFFKALLLDQIAAHDGAVDALQKAIYLDRELVLAHYYLGTTLQKLSILADAATSFRNVQRLLAGRNPSECLPCGEDMTVADLDALTQLQIGILRKV